MKCDDKLSSLETDYNRIYGQANFSRKYRSRRHCTCIDGRIQSRKPSCADHQSEGKSRRADCNEEGRDVWRTDSINGKPPESGRRSDGRIRKAGVAGACRQPGADSLVCIPKPIKPAEPPG